jgi:hypothetical protein
MKKTVIRSLAALVFMGLCLAAALCAQDGGNAKSQLTVPWEEFKKLLRVDEKDIVLPLETFDKLIAQTGVKTPPHAVREGLVVMSRAAFRQLVDEMKTPDDSGAVPPFDYIITKSVYSGNVGKNGTRFTARFSIQVLKKNAYLKIPLLPQNAALEDMKVDGGAALTVSEGGMHEIVLSKQGEHVAEAVFTLQSNLTQGPNRFEVAIQPTPITLLRLEIPLKDVDVEIPQAQVVAVEPVHAGTAVSAVLSSVQSFSVAWRKKVPVQEKLPPRLYAEVNHLLSIEEDALRFNSDIVFDILHSEIDEVSLAVPDDCNVLGVSGEGVGAWREKVVHGERVITVPFTYGRKGNAVVHVLSEKPISDRGASNVFTGFRALNVVRETGYIGVELNTGAEVKAAEAAGLTRVAVPKLPPMLYNKSAKPLILAYKYVRHPFNLVLEVEKHEKIAVPMASVVSANAVTLFTEDGKVVHRLIYQVRNSEKQFIEIKLPRGADVWSVFVGNEPVESSLGSEGKLLVPLARSRLTGVRLEAFPVEVIYCLSEEPFRAIGWLRASLPPVDVMTSQIFWSVYVPNDYAYLYFKSTLEKEEIIRGLNLLGARRRVLTYSRSAPAGGNAGESDQMKKEAREAYKGKDYKSQFRNVPVQEEQSMQQLDAEMNFGGKLDELGQAAPQTGVSGGGAGVLPIQIEVPTTGQVYRFAKTIVKPEDGLNVGVLVLRRGFFSLLLWILFLFIAWIAYRIRKTLGRGFALLTAYWKRVQPILEKAEVDMPRILGSRRAVLILVLSTLVLLIVSRWLFVLSLILLCIVLVVQGVLRFKERRKTNPKKQDRRMHSTRSSS